jgi:hypothetical protein
MPVSRGYPDKSKDVYNPRAGATTVKSGVKTLTSTPPPPVVRTEDSDQVTQVPRATSPTITAPKGSPSRSLASPRPVSDPFPGVTAGVTTSGGTPEDTPPLTLTEAMNMVASNQRNRPAIPMPQPTNMSLGDVWREVINSFRGTESPPALDVSVGRPAKFGYQVPSEGPEKFGSALTERKPSKPPKNTGHMPYSGLGWNPNVKPERTEAQMRADAMSASYDVNKYGPPLAEALDMKSIPETAKGISGIDLTADGRVTEIPIGSYSGSVGEYLEALTRPGQERAAAKEFGTVTVSQSEVDYSKEQWQLAKPGQPFPLGAYIPVRITNPNTAGNGLFVDDYIDAYGNEVSVFTNSFTDQGLMQLTGTSTPEEARLNWMADNGYAAPNPNGAWFIVDEQALVTVWEQINLALNTSTSPSPDAGSGTLAADKVYGGGGGGGGGGDYSGYSEPAPAPVAEITSGAWSEGYQVENAPTWWVGLVNSVPSPENEYAMQLNAMIPYLSPEDQRYVAQFLFSSFPSIFSMYKDISFAPPPFEITADIRDRFTSSDRARGIIETLNKMRQAAGMTEEQLGPGYRYLNRLADVMAQYGGGPLGSNDRQTSRQYTQMMSALDPLIAESKGDELSAYGSLASRLTNPFFSAGKVVPISKDQSGNWVFGETNKQFASY